MLVMPSEILAQQRPNCFEVEGEIGKFRCGTNGTATSTVFAPGSRIIKPREFYKYEDEERQIVGPAINATAYALNFRQNRDRSELRFGGIGEVYRSWQEQSETRWETSSDTDAVGAITGITAGTDTYAVALAVEFFDEKFTFDGGNTDRSGFGISGSTVFSLGNGWTAYGSLQSIQSELDIERDTLFGNSSGGRDEFGRTGGKTDSSTFIATAGTGKVIEISPSWFGSLNAMIYYEHEKIDGYQERALEAVPEKFWNKGDPTIRFDSETKKSLQAQLGGELAYNLQKSGVSYTPSISAKYVHEFKDDARSITAVTSRKYNSNIGESPLSFETAEPDRNFFLIGLGLEIQPSTTWGFSTSYTRLIGHDYRDQEILAATLWIDF